MGDGDAKGRVRSRAQNEPQPSSQKRWFKPRATWWRRRGCEPEFKKALLHSMRRDKWTQGASLEASDKDSPVSGGGITVNTPWVWGCSGSLGMVLAVRAQNNPGQFSRRRRGDVGYLGPCPLYRTDSIESWGQGQWLRHIPLRRLLERGVPFIPCLPSLGFQTSYKKVVFLHETSTFENLSQFNPTLMYSSNFQGTHILHFDSCVNPPTRNSVPIYIVCFSRLTLSIYLFLPALRGILFPRDLSAWFILPKFWSLIWFINSTDFLLCD